MHTLCKLDPYMWVRGVAVPERTKLFRATCADHAGSWHAHMPEREATVRALATSAKRDIS